VRAGGQGSSRSTAAVRFVSFSLGRARIVVHQPGGPGVLTLEERPIPTAAPRLGTVRVRAFGLNRAELITRSGGSGDAVKFPRVIGIECAGEVVEAADGDLRAGQTVVAAMGEIGRAFDDRLRPSLDGGQPRDRQARRPDTRRLTAAAITRRFNTRCTRSQGRPHQRPLSYPARFDSHAVRDRGGAGRRCCLRTRPRTECFRLRRRC
jgi:hypothetical protein